MKTLTSFLRYFLVIIVVWTITALGAAAGTGSGAFDSWGEFFGLQHTSNGTSAGAFAAADYTVTTAANNIIVTDTAGNGDTLAVSEPAAGNIMFAASGRTFSVDGGPAISGDSGSLPLAGISSIVIDQGGGNDTVNIGAFTAAMPGLTINGGEGSDNVNFNGDITFATNASLDVDMQNDAPTPGTDSITLSTGTNLILSGAGTATLKVSKGVMFWGGTSITAVDGDIVVEGNQQAVPSTGNFLGIYLGLAGGPMATISSTGGNVILKGRGGDGPATNEGIVLYVATVSGGPAGKLTSIVGQGGGGTGGGHCGVTVTNGSTVTSKGGNIQVTGSGGVNGTGGAAGITLGGSSIISAGGTGTVTLAGTGGGVSGTYNHGIYSYAVSITSAASVSLTGIEGSGSTGLWFNPVGGSGTSVSTTANAPITMIANSMAIGSSSSANAGGGTVTLRPYTNTVGIDLGSVSDPTGGPLSLSDAELDLISGATIQIGDSNSGSAAVSSNITRSSATNFSLTSGANINISGGSFNSGGGSVTLDPGTNVFASNSGVDVNTAAAKLTIASGKDLRTVINGTTADTGYTQLNVAGKVDITGVDLVYTGSYLPAGGDVFIIISNDGTDAVTGTFNGLPQGATVSTNFLDSGLTAKISYIGGDGNDVVVTVLANFTLTVTRTGEGTVQSSPVGINCGVTCAASYSDGTVVDLTATPGSGLTFIGWSGACTGTGTCSVTMSQARSVGAAFADTTPPAAPSITGSTPPSPGASTIPTILGTAEAGSTVKLYTTADCTGGIAGTGTATGGSFAIGVTVGANSTTMFYASATDAASNVSPCSNLFSYKSLSVRADFDGDGKTDVSVFRPSSGIWFLNRSLAGFAGAQFGTTDDLITPADFTGDGKTDIAVFRPSSGAWFIMRSEDNTYYGVKFGVSGDIPAPADYDGDGMADLAVFRPSAGTWFLQQSTAGFAAIGFGIDGDKPTVGDFDGDGKADVAVYRPLEQNWYRLNSSNGSFFAVRFGASGDKVVPADYTGDGKADVAVWRPSTGTWFVLKSDDGSFYGAQFGSDGDLPVPGDYDGDGKADVAVYRPQAGTWFEMQSTSGFKVVQFGTAEDKPGPNAFVF